MSPEDESKVTRRDEEDTSVLEQPTEVARSPESGIEQTPDEKGRQYIESIRKTAEGYGKLANILLYSGAVGVLSCGAAGNATGSAEVGGAVLVAGLAGLIGGVLVGVPADGIKSDINKLEEPNNG
jgi:hypothetical protein